MAERILSVRCPSPIRGCATCVVASALWVVGVAMPAAAGERGPFSARVFEPGTDCRYAPAGAAGLRISDHFIAGPTSLGDRPAWLAALRNYRNQIRNSRSEPVLHVNFRGVRAWVRLAKTASTALALQPGQALLVTVDARAIEGNSELCVAFDVHDRTDDAKVGWTGVRATLAIGKDGDWHRVSTTVKVPQFPADKQWLRPIVGMDGTHDRTPGQLEIRDITLRVDDPARMQSLHDALAALAAPAGLDRSLYDRPDLAWAARTFTCHFTFMYDRAFYDPRAGRYTLEEFLDDGQRTFGGYDILVLWQAYPRIGVDPRNQFDMYRDMPGGLAGLKKLVGRAHDRGCKVFIDYNPWDCGTRREGKPDEHVLADLVAAIEADGIFLDTMSAASMTLRQCLDRARPGVALAPEGHPAIDQLAMLSASWAQWIADPHPPGLLHLKWIEPRHMQHQIRRWDRDHASEIETAFFNGSGMLVWENIFGTYNPWPIENRRTWRRAVAILRRFAENFTSDRWEPFYPTAREKLFAHRWPGDEATVFTLLNRGEPIKDSVLLELPAAAETVYFDLWAGRPAKTVPSQKNVRIVGSVDRLGCILALPKRSVDPTLLALLEKQQAFERTKHEKDHRNIARSVEAPEPVARTRPAKRSDPGPGMVFVPGATIRMKIKHQRRECGCYPDPSTPEADWPAFLWGHPFNGTITHDIGPVKVRSFFIDEAEVSNGDFKRFLDEAGYRPKHPENFLRHWPKGEIPQGQADHPVVYVDVDDARAYARWAGKRLPTEPEWHLAAQGTDGRKWPWGNAFDAARCNTTGDRTLPVRSLAAGRSPCGCYHMAGNVWEWTESVRDDGHTRFAIIRGGSYFEAKGSVWYVRGGPRPCDHHAKFLLMWPGLDRCATVGFRCVVDAAD